MGTSRDTRTHPRGKGAGEGYNGYVSGRRRSATISGGRRHDTQQIRESMPNCVRIAEGAAWYGSGRSKCLRQAVQTPAMMQCGFEGNRRRAYTGAALAAVEGGKRPAAAGAGTERDKRPQTTCSQCATQESHCIGGFQLATQWVRIKMMPPPTHGRRKTRSIGATQSKTAEELASVLGEYAVLRRLPVWYSVGCDPAIRMRLFTRIELSRPFA